MGLSRSKDWCPEDGDLLGITEETNLSLGSMCKIRDRFNTLDTDNKGKHAIGIIKNISVVNILKGYLVKDDLLKLVKVEINPIGEKLAETILYPPLLLDLKEKMSDKVDFRLL